MEKSGFLMATCIIKPMANNNNNKSFTLTATFYRNLRNTVKPKTSLKNADIRSLIADVFLQKNMSLYILKNILITPELLIILIIQ